MAGERKRTRAPAQDPDLGWFFRESEGAIAGAGSSFGALVDLALSGAVRGPGGGRSRTPPDHRLRSVREARALEAALARLSLVDQRVLRLAYGPAEWPAEMRQPKRYGAWPGVLLVTTTLARAFAREVERRRERARARAGRETVREEGDTWLRGEDLMASVDAFSRRGPGEWIRSAARGDDEIRPIREEAARLVEGAYERWMGVWWSATVARPRERARVHHSRRPAFDPFDGVRAA